MSGASLAMLAAGIAMIAAALGGMALVAPRVAFRFYRLWLNPLGIAAASLLRLAFGIAVLFVAPDTTAGWALRGLGVLSLLGAFIGPVLGVERARRIVEWEARQPSRAIRVAGGLVLVLALWMTCVLLSIAGERIAAMGSLLGQAAYLAVDD